MTRDAEVSDGVAESRANMRFLIRSACWGAIPQVMVKDSSLFIVFAALVGAGDMVSVMCTALNDAVLCLLMLPFAMLSDRIGVRRQLVTAVCAGVGALLLAAASPWLGASGGGMLLLALALFAVAMSAYSAAWFPLLEQVVPPSERGLFFGRMRFSWQLVSAAFIAVSGLFIGRFATVGRL